MPRRNILLLIVVSVLALACYWRIQKNPYIRVITEAVKTIERHSLRPVDDKQLYEGAMQGMLSQLDDHSCFIPAAVLQAFEEEIDCNFVGIGVEIVVDPDTNRLTVRSPVVGSPAYDAGVLAGDRIMKVDGRSTEGMDTLDAKEVLRGPAGSQVTLTVLHVGEKDPVDITITRQLVHVNTVLGNTRYEDGSWDYFLDGHDKIAYVRIISFGDGTAEELYSILGQLRDRGMRGLVVDLRNDPGGLLSAAVSICNQFISSGVIVSTRLRGGVVDDIYVADGVGEFTEVPMAMIVNGETASAAEILAACVQDHDRAVIVGQRTYGKGTVQKLIHLQPGCGAMKLTTASYWRPSGKDIQCPQNATDQEPWGVMPNKGYEVVLTDEEFVEWQLWRWKHDVYQRPGKTEETEEQDGKEAKPYVDRQRRRAVEYIEQVLKQQAPAAESK